MATGTKDRTGHACLGDRSLSVEHVSDVAGLRRLRPEWNDLLCASPASNVFLTWEWIATWWEHFGRAGDLLVLAVRDELGRLVGLAPLRLEYESALPLTRARTVTFIGLGGPLTPEYLDLIALPAYEGPVISAVLDWLDEHSGEWDVIRLARAADDSLTVRRFVQGAARRNYWCLSGESKASWYAALPASWEEYDRHCLRGGTRRDTRRRARRLAAEHHVQTVDLADESSPGEAVDLVASLHGSRARMVGRPSAFSRRGYTEFHRQFAAESANQGWLRTLAMLVDGAPAAANYAFAYDGALYDYQQGFDPRYARFSVGRILTLQFIRQCIIEGLDRYDLLTGDDAYKRELCSRPRWQCTYLLAPPDRQGVPMLMRRLAGAMRSTRATRPRPERAAERIAVGAETLQ